MSRLRYLTAGETHGPAQVGILEGLPAGVRLESADLERELSRHRRFGGEGEGAEIVAGVRFGQTLGSGLALVIRNRDSGAWQERTRVEPGGPEPEPVLVPRPGHADLAAALKYGHAGDLRGAFEPATRGSMQVALGAVAKVLLRELGIGVGSYVRSIGGVEGVGAEVACPELLATDAEGLAAIADATASRALEPASSRLDERVRAAVRGQDTVGGVLELLVTNVPPGLGSHVQADRALEGRLAGALAAVSGVVGVELGEGALGAGRSGRAMGDPFRVAGSRIVRTSNRAGGLEGGLSNGQPLVLRVAVRTIGAGPSSVDLRSLQPTPAPAEGERACAVPAASIVAEAVAALALANALLEVIPSDTLAGMRAPFARLRVADRLRLGHVFLFGPMGSGKSAVGTRLAEQLGLPFVDLDAHVERSAGRAISEIFRTDGEATFRALEAEALRRVCDEAPAVVALGGGAAQTEEAWRRLRASGVVVGLHAPVPLIVERLRHGEGEVSTRPLLAQGDPEGRLTELIRSRARWYARPDVVLDTSGLDVDQTASAVRGLLRSLEGALAGAPAAEGPR